MCKHRKLFSESMTPKVIEHSDFKYREEIANEVVQKLIIEGGSEKVKECLTNVWGYNPEDNVAVPILMIGQEGKADGAKWVEVAMFSQKRLRLNSYGKMLRKISLLILEFLT